MGGLLSSSPPPPPPGPRQFRPVSTADGESEAAPSVKVVTYNVLCDAYVTDRSFPPDTYPRPSLQWAGEGGREARLLEELAGYGPDVLFLQEVAEEAWGGRLGSTLRGRLGYEGAWFWTAPPPPGGARARGAPLKPRKGAPKVGPALLVRGDRFRVLATASIAFRDARCAADLAGGHTPTAALLAGSRDGAVAAVLEDGRADGPPPSRRLLVASAHLNWDYRTPDLKVLQAAALCDELRRFWEAVVGGGGGEEGLPPPPLILGGDFNSLPLDRASNAAPGAPSCAGTPSGVYALLTQGRLSPAHPHHPARQRGGSPGVVFDTAGWAGGLTSARAVAGGGGEGSTDHPATAEPALTTRTHDFEGTLDYLFLSTPHWRVVAVLSDPWEGGGSAGVAVAPDLATFPAMPNADWPSDHLAVGAAVCRR